MKQPYVFEVGSTVKFKETAMNLALEQTLTITPVNCDIPTMDMLCYVEIGGHSVPDIFLSSSTLGLWQGVWLFSLTIAFCALFDSIHAKD